MIKVSNENIMEKHSPSRTELKRLHNKIKSYQEHIKDYEGDLNADFQRYKQLRKQLKGKEGYIMMQYIKQNKYLTIYGLRIYIHANNVITFYF